MNVLLGSPKIKSRSITPVTATLYSDTYNASHVLTDHFLNGTATVSTFGEQIVYTTKRKNQRAKSNYCNHLKETFHYGNGLGPETFNLTAQPGWTVDYTGHHYNCCNAKASILSAVETALVRTKGAVLGTEGQAFINDAWDRLRPDLRSVSIPNFLADIADLKSLFVLWKKRVSIAKNLAGAHLNYKFGWRPSVGDIADLLKGLVRLKDRIAAFENALGGTRQDTAKVNLTLPTSVSGTITYPSGGHTASYVATCERKAVCYVAWQPLPIAAIGSLDKVVRGMLDALGFELNPRIIWDALPFTFVIDWFFGVGSFLDRFRIDALELPVVLADSFIQYEEKLHIEWSWLRANDGTYTKRPKSGNATYERKFFHRMPIYPDYATLTGLGWRMPTLNQATLLLSLSTVLSKGK